MKAEKDEGRKGEDVENIYLCFLQTLKDIIRSIPKDKTSFPFLDVWVPKNNTAKFMVKIVQLLS